MDTMRAFALAAKARADAATQGPWEVSAEHNNTPVVCRSRPDIGSNFVQVIATADWGTEEDMRFIAAAREDVGVLSDAVVELLSQVERLLYANRALEGC